MEASSDSAMESKKEESTNPPSKGFRAIVIGGSGRVGRVLVSQLIASDSFTKVTSISRRELPITEDEKKNPKLVQNLIDMDKLSGFKNYFLKDMKLRFVALAQIKNKQGLMRISRRLTYIWLRSLPRFARKKESIIFI